MTKHVFIREWLSGFFYLLQISAQESRRKKKEYMDTLEKRMDGLSNEVDTYRQKCIYLEQQNSALQLQVQKLQAQLSASKTTTTTGTAISNNANNKANSQNQVEDEQNMDPPIIF